MATASLIAYALGLVGFILVKVLASSYFSRQDTRTPVRIGEYASVLNIGLNVVLVVSLIRTEFYAPHAGLALATTLSAFFNALMLFRGLRKNNLFQPRPGWGLLTSQVLGATAIMACGVFWLAGRMGDWLLLGVLERVGSLTICVFTGVGIYLGACYLFGLRVQSFRKTPLANL